jgi:hypothetical protein
LVGRGDDKFKLGDRWNPGMIYAGIRGEALGRAYRRAERLEEGLYVIGFVLGLMDLHQALFSRINSIDLMKL